MDRDPFPILDAIAQTIYDKKGRNILALDVRGLSPITDFLVIAEGHVDRHVVGLAQAVEGCLRERGLTPVHVEGREAGDWIVLDYHEIMVHLFMPGLRDKYQLEQLWPQATLLELKIDLSRI